MSDDERHDAMLMEILRDKKTVVGFLESIFGFLSRRTDFYCELKSPTDQIGFPPGVKEKLVLSVLKRFNSNEAGDIELQTVICDADNTAPPASEEIEVQTITEDDITMLTQQKSNSNPYNETKNINKESHQFQSSASKMNTDFQPNEYYNGAKFETYCWSQTINDLEIYIRLPDHIKSGKNVNVEILPDFIKVEDRLNNKENVIFEGKMHLKCKNKNAVWSISSGKLQITLDKTSEIWWNKLLEKEPSLDLSRIDCSRDYYELSEETQTALEKIRWDEKHKLLGLPTSDEIRNTELLRKAWNVEGSPFKGQPFDPSNVKFN